MNRLVVFLVVLAAVVVRSDGQTVEHAPDPGKPLTERWKWALGKSIVKGYWIGYSFERQMGERSFIGSFYSDERKNRPSLLEMLTGRKPDERLLSWHAGRSGDIQGMFDNDDDRAPVKEVMKEVGILFHIQPGTGQQCDDLKVSNLSLRVDLEGDPLLWIGSASQTESLDFLEARFKDAPLARVRKGIIMAIGLHESEKSSIQFLKNILLGEDESDLRKEAAFWLSQTHAPEAREILMRAAREDRSEEVREESIFGLSQLPGEGGLDALITLAKDLRDSEERKKAIFWISQKASEKAVGALKAFVEKDHDTEIQRSALFALTQIDGSGGIDELISVAKSHPNPKIRKEAIFWLGQSDDPKALQALVSIAKQ